MINTGLMKLGRRDYSPIGIDIGETSIRMAQLQNTSRGWIVRDLQVRNIPASDKVEIESRRDALIETIMDCMAASSFTGRSVVSSIPAYHLEIFPVKLPLSERKEELEEAIIKEASSHISYELEDAVIDYIPVEPSGSDTEKEQIERFLVVSARRNYIDELLSVLKGAKLKPKALDISASALTRALRLSRKSRGKSVLVINVSEQHTTLTIIFKDNIFVDRTVFWGTEILLENLMVRLKLDREKAIGLLNRVGLHQIVGGTPDHSEKISKAIYEIIVAQLDKLAKEVDVLLRYFASEMRGAAIDTVYLMGTAGHIRDLYLYLEKRTGIETEHFNLLDLIEIDSMASRENNGRRSLFDVSLGLAMRGLNDKNARFGENGP